MKESHHKKNYFSVLDIFYYSQGIVIPYEQRFKEFFKILIKGKLLKIKICWYYLSRQVICTWSNLFISIVRLKWSLYSIIKIVSLFIYLFIFILLIVYIKLFVFILWNKILDCILFRTESQSKVIILSLQNGEKANSIDEDMKLFIMVILILGNSCGMVPMLLDISLHLLLFENYIVLQKTQWNGSLYDLIIFTIVWLTSLTDNIIVKGELSKGTE